MYNYIPIQERLEGRHLNLAVRTLGMGLREYGSSTGVREYGVWGYMSKVARDGESTGVREGVQEEVRE